RQRTASPACRFTERSRKRNDFRARASPPCKWGLPPVFGSGRRGLPDDVERLHDLGEVAGTRVTLAAVDQRRLFLCADRLRLPATRPEAAAARRGRPRRDIPLENDPPPAG